MMPESADSTNAAEGLWTAPTPTTWPQSYPMFPFAGWGQKEPSVGSHHKAGVNVSVEFVLPEITFLLARTAVLIQFVRAIPAVILAVTEEPLRDAPVVCVARAPPPPLRAVRVPALVRRLITVISAVVVEIAPPQLRDALAVVARKLLRAIAGPVVADGVF